MQPPPPKQPQQAAGSRRPAAAAAATAGRSAAAAGRRQRSRLSSRAARAAARTSSSSSAALLQGNSDSSSAAGTGARALERGQLGRIAFPRRWRAGGWTVRTALPVAAAPPTRRATLPSEWLLQDTGGGWAGARSLCAQIITTSTGTNERAQTRVAEQFPLFREDLTRLDPNGQPPLEASKGAEALGTEACGLCRRSCRCVAAACRLSRVSCLSRCSCWLHGAQASAAQCRCCGARCPVLCGAKSAPCCSAGVPADRRPLAASARASGATRWALRRAARRQEGWLADGCRRR